MGRHLTPVRLALAGLLLLAVVAVVLVFTPTRGTYLFLPDEAHPVDPLVSVQGGHRPRGPGGIFFVDVIVRKATLIERLFPGLHDGAELVPAHAINPTGISEQARRQGNLRQMTRSQSIAAAVALRALGFDVNAVPQGAFVAQVLPNTPAAAALQPTDVIVAVDREPVRTPADLRRLVGARPPGSKLRLTIRRGSSQRHVSLTTIESDSEPGRSVIGVLVEQEANIQLPISVRIDAGDVGGPSAGLAFALDILEELGRDVDHGCNVAATGELALDGRVEPVGGLEQKTIGARRTGIDVFVVPAGDNAEEARRYSDGLRVVPVESFQQALRSLATATAICKK